MIYKADYLSSPHIGIFCVVNDNVALVPKNCPAEFTKLLKNKLEVDIVKTSMARTSLLGIFCALNNKKIIIPDILEPEELLVLKNNFSEVLVLEEKYTAIGNLVAMNDNGIACIETLSKHIKGSIAIKVAGSDLVGSSLFVNNSGFLAPPDSTESEVKQLEKIFKVKGGIGTVNFGDPFVNSGIIGNKKGIITGQFTSGPELNRIDDIFILGG